MLPRGKIRHIGAYSPAQLEQMKKDLGLLMPLSFLNHCAKYYVTRARRDPLIEELKALDLFAASMQKSPTAQAPTEMQTNDAFIAATYADMMAKRRELSPNTKTPLSLGESLGLARTYLLRAGKRNGLGKDTLFCRELGKHSFAPCDAAVVSDGGFSLRVLDACSLPSQSDDLFALLLPEIGTHAQSGFDAKCNKLLSTQEFASSIGKITTLSHGGLLSALLKEGVGIFLDTARLSQSNELFPLEHLVNAFEDAYLIRFARQNETLVRRLARDAGIRACVFAGVTTTDTLVISRSKNDTLTLHIDFLRSLSSFVFTKLTLGEETPDAILSPRTETRNKKICKYLFDPERNAPTLNLDIERKLVASASVSPERSFFLNALYCAIAPILSQSLAGCHYSAQQLAIGIRLPSYPVSAEASAAALSTSLGLYRLQSETGILAASLRTVSDPDVSLPQLSVFSVAAGAAPCPSVLQIPENRVYAISIKTDPSGLPDFESLRRTLASLAKLRNDGVTVSARCVFGKKISDALMEMESNGLYCHINDGKLLTAPASPLAVILEASCEIDGLPCLGRVAQREAKVEDAPKIVTLLPGHSLIWSEAPEIVMLAKRSDADAKQLSALLADEGAHVHLFFEDSDSLPLSRALLGAQTLIICEDATLPSSSQVNFAYQTMRHAGGRTLALGSKCRNGAISISCGLTPQNLAILCQKN